MMGVIPNAVRDLFLILTSQISYSKSGILSGDLGEISPAALHVMLVISLRELATD
jgi:hypothetical protein